MESFGVSVKVAKDSILGVAGRRQTDQGTDYCSLILTWLREDGIPTEKIQEYGHHVARTHHRKSLRKREREYSSYGDDDDAGARMLQKIRR